MQKWQCPIHNGALKALLDINNFENCFFSIVVSTAEKHMDIRQKHKHKKTTITFTILIR